MTVFGILGAVIVFLGAASLGYVFFDVLERRASELSRRGEATGAAALSAAAVASSPRRLFRKQLFLAAALFLLGLIAVNIVLGLLLAPLGYLLPLISLRKAAEKRMARITEQLVEALQLMGSGLKSGLNLTQAIELLVHDFPPPISEEFNQVLAETRLGVGITEALSNMASRLRIPVVNILATGVAVTSRCGGDLSEIFQHIAETIRARALIEKKVDAVTSLGRTQALVLSCMPVALAVVLYFIDPQHVLLLFQSSFGLAALAGAIGLIVVANLWMRRLTRVEV
jgi:tight adherence protein B